MKLTERLALKRPGLLVCVLMLTVMSGCATVGESFPVAPVSEIRIGETNKGQVREMFGPPWRVGVENGKRTWTYGHYQYRLIGKPSTRDLLIRFDNRNLVEHFSFNTTDHGGRD